MWAEHGYRRMGQVRVLLKVGREWKDRVNIQY